MGMVTDLCVILCEPSLVLTTAGNIVHFDLASWKPRMSK